MKTSNNTNYRSATQEEANAVVAMLKENNFALVATPVASIDKDGNTKYTARADLYVLEVAKNDTKKQVKKAK